LIVLATVIIFLLIVGGIALAYAGSAHGWLPRSRDEAETLVFGSLFMVFLVVVSLAILSQWPGPRRALYLVVALALCVQAAAIAIDVVVHRGAATWRASRWASAGGTVRRDPGRRHPARTAPAQTRVTQPLLGKAA
jgi:hypothetical protein